MNILFVAQFFSATAGAPLVFHNWAEGMARRGHSVDVLCYRATGSIENALPDVTVHRIGPTMKEKSGIPPSVTQHLRYIISGILKGSQIIRKKKIDIIHTDSFSSVIVGSILAKIHNIPVVASIHDVFTTSSPDNWRMWAAQNNLSRISSMIGPLFEKITVKMPSDTILTGSNASKDDLINFKAKPKITVIPYGIDLNQYNHKFLRSRGNYDNYVLFIGRLVFYKNLQVIIHAFKEVVKILPHAKLVVIGEGPMKDKWQKISLELGLSPYIEFTGFISQEKKIELLNHCSVLVFPSVFEGFGLVVLEAFAMNKPVLVADVKPSDEIVHEGIDGFMLPAHDPQKWAEKIIFLLSNKAICANMGSKGRDKVENQFNIDHVLDRIESLYVELCSQKKSKRSWLF